MLKSCNVNFPMTAPKSVDFIILVDCECDTYVLYVLEFKNVNSPKRLNIHDIQDKFTNTIEDFIKDKFKHVFLNPKYKYRKIFLYLVSDAYQEKYRRCHHEISDTLKVDMNLSSKIYKIHGKVCYIKYDIPPNPIIKKLT